MMRFLSLRVSRVMAVGLTLGLTTAAAWAQGPPRGPGGPGAPGGPGGPSLVMTPEVQKELGLTEKQAAQVKKLEAALERKRRELFAEEGDEGGDPRARMGTLMGLQREVETSVTKTLNKRQKDRLAQLELQREGPMALARKEIASKIKLTTAQSKEVKAIVDEMRAAMASSMPRPPGGGPPNGGRGGPATNGSQRGGPNRAPGDDSAPREEEAAVAPGENGPPAPRGEGPAGGRSRRAGGPEGGRPNFDSPEFQAQFAKMREAQERIRTTATQKIDEVLTAEQKASFAKLLGEPFDFSTIRRRPGAPGRPGRGPATKGSEQPNPAA